MITIIIPVTVVKIICVVLVAWTVWLAISIPLYLIDWILKRRIAKVRKRLESSR